MRDTRQQAHQLIDQLPDSQLSALFGSGNELAREQKAVIRLIHSLAAGSARSNGAAGERNGR